MSTQSNDIAELAKALASAQSKIKPAVKDSTNPHFRSKYADLQSIWESARQVLAPNGLSVTQTFEPSNGETVTVSTLLMHASGQWIRSSLTLKPSKPDPQGIGSAATYGRRYGLSAILGIVADEDDDGNGASAPKHDTKPTGTPVAPVEPPKPLTAETRKALEFFAATPKGRTLLDKIFAAKSIMSIDEMSEDTGRKSLAWLNEQSAKPTKDKAAA